MLSFVRLRRLVRVSTDIIGLRRVLVKDSVAIDVRPLPTFAVRTRYGTAGHRTALVGQASVIFFVLPTFERAKE